MKKGLVVLVLCYIGLAVLANWLAAKYVGPTALPVGFGLTAPGGVYAIGFVLCARDWANQISTWASVVAIPVAAGISYAVAELAGWVALERIAVASVCAFLVSEAVEFVVFWLLRKQPLAWRVAVSGSIGLVLDSLIFLTVAFGSLAYLDGQLVGKAEALALGVALTAGRRLVFPVKTAPVTA